METENDDIKALVRKIFPKTVTLSKAKACPSEEEISSFIDGKLEAKKEGNLISHLVECKDCLETIKFLRQNPSDEEVHVPAWLEQKVKEIFPARPKTWEIVLGKVPPFLEVVRHTAELCLTIPELRVIPTRGSFQFEAEKAERSPKEEGETPVTEEKSSYVPGKFSKPTRSDFGKKYRDTRAYESPLKPFESEGEDFYMRKEEAHKVVESFRSQVPKGFVFQEHLGDYSVHLFLSKKEDEETVEVQIETRDSSGQSVEDMEILFVQGRKVLGKMLTGKESHISKMLKSRSRIKFKHKGIHLGEAILDFREKVF